MSVLVLSITSASARKVAVPRMYMFGMAAAFTDTIVHFTNIQTLDSVWIESKNKFLQNREEYSLQLKQYLSQQQQMNNRTCIVFYAEKREKLEKKYLKMKALYDKEGKDGIKHFDVRYIPDSNFKFKTIKVDPGDAQ